MTKHRIPFRGEHAFPDLMRKIGVSPKLWCAEKRALVYTERIARSNAVLARRRERLAKQHD